MASSFVHNYYIYNYYNMITTIIYSIGLYQVIRFALALFWQILKEIIPAPSTALDKYGRKDGKWAVVTGGTDGVGLGFCEVLAEMGWNLCIISRNQEKLKRTINNLTEDLKNKGNKIPLFQYIVADFKNSSQKDFFNKITDQLSRIRIGILVNNVGTGDTMPYEEYNIDSIIDLVNINIISMAGLTNALLPQMMKEKTAIINLSSFLGESPVPYSTLYCASKAFNTFFSESLSMEQNLKNIDILSVRPMFVVSPLSKKTQSFTIPDRKSCARACLRELRWQYETNGYFVHRVMALFSKLIPKQIYRPLCAQISKKEYIQYKNRTS